MSCALVPVVLCNSDNIVLPLPGVERPCPHVPAASGAETRELAATYLPKDGSYYLSVVRDVRSDRLCGGHPGSVFLGNYGLVLQLLLQLHDF